MCSECVMQERSPVRHVVDISSVVCDVPYSTVDVTLKKRLHLCVRHGNGPICTQMGIVTLPQQQSHCPCFLVEWEMTRKFRSNLHKTRIVF